MNTTTPIVTCVAPADWASVEDWGEAVAESARPSAFLTREWLAPWWNVFGRGLQPYLLRVGSEGADGVQRTLGLAPFYLSSSGGIRRLGLIGDRCAGSEYLGLVARVGAEDVVARAVFGQLRDHVGQWDVAVLPGLRDDDPVTHALVRALGAGAARMERSVPHPCSRAALPDEFEAYLAALSSKFRQSYRQRTNKLLRSHSVRFVLTATERELDVHLDELFAMHQAHWVAAGEPGSFADPRMISFYREMGRALLGAGRLRFWHLEVDGVRRASQFGFVHAKVLHSLQEAYDGSFRSPGVGGLGVVLRGHALQAAIEEGISAYDFLGGDEDFKQRWGTTTHHVRTVTARSPGVRGAAGWLTLDIYERAKKAFTKAAPPPLLRVARRVRTLGSPG